ncbi:Putative neugrin/Rrg9 [Septoria linicola]|uniref:Required for respiratory growth protein 9, mitochondrial n=1 Tax=Septoria linicola TaxID=215465 RepID=A0A9Q9AGZ6_9PEZI|nr:putative neugrin/Rrg9 [Septoria linicola]USW47454.1 Putative neugrin/Rrg9 [Septoria linicola]
MHKCTASSTKALDVFVKELAGLHVRHQRAQLYFQRCRAFGTATPGNTVVDDECIPFDLTRKLKRSSAGDTLSQQQQQHQQHQHQQHPEQEPTTDDASAENEHVQADWHAEVDINAPLIATKGDAPEALESAATLRTHSTPEWVKPAAQKPLSRKQRAVQKANSSEKTATDARMARKERRQAEGRIRASREDKQERVVGSHSTRTDQGPDSTANVDEDTNQVHTVLAKLDQDLGGPSIIKAQQKAAERLATKSIEKKRKAQLVAAKKQDDQRKAVAEAEAQRIKKMEPWQRDKSALQQKFGEKGWAPRKRLSPDSLEGIRALHGSDPATYTTAMLSEHFQITPEAIRRILKSKWKPKPEEIEKRMERWEARGVKKWQEMSEQGMKPPKKWRMMGVSNPKLESRKKWEDVSAEKPINPKTGKKERWKNLDKRQQDMGTTVENSLAGRL